MGHREDMGYRAHCVCTSNIRKIAIGAVVLLTQWCRSSGVVDAVV